MPEVRIVERSIIASAIISFSIIDLSTIAHADASLPTSRTARDTWRDRCEAVLQRTLTASAPSIISNHSRATRTESISFRSDGRRVQETLRFEVLPKRGARVIVTIGLSSVDRYPPPRHDWQRFEGTPDDRGARDWELLLKKEAPRTLAKVIFSSDHPIDFSPNFEQLWRNAIDECLR